MTTATKPVLPKCENCRERAAKVIFRDIPGEVETYLFEECADCMERLCEKCIIHEGEEALCETCYGTRCLKG